MNAVLHWWTGHQAYFLTHPELLVLVVWPVLTAVMSFAQNMIAARAPRLAAFLLANGWDAKRGASVLWSLLTGGKVAPPADPPAPPPAEPAASKVPPVTLLCLALVLCGCGITARQAVDGALSVEQLACVIMQSELGTSEPEAVSAICAIPTGLIREIEDVLLAKAKGHEMALAVRSDAGCPAVKP